MPVPAALGLALTLALAGQRLSLPGRSPGAGVVVIEGEALVGAARATEGRVVRQDMRGFGPQWSGGAQLFWTPRTDGAELTATVVVPSAGTFDVEADVTVAPDYGEAAVFLAGAPGGRIQGYGPRVATGRSVLGRAMLTAGAHQLTIKVMGRDPRSTGSYVGLDRIVLRPVAAEAPPATEGLSTTGPPSGPSPVGTVPPAPDTPPGPPQVEPPPPVPPPGPPPQPWTTRDVLDPRIDVAAQYALLRMFKGEPGEWVVASDILGAVKSGALGGIYQEDQKVPALRAQAAGSGWWKILPRETVKPRVDGVCMMEPPGKPPILVMRRKAEKNPAAYDAALSLAWAGCGFPPQPTRPYAKNVPGKEPPPRGQRCAQPSPRPIVSVGVFIREGDAFNPVNGTKVTVEGEGAIPQTKTTASGLATFDLARPGLVLVTVSALPGILPAVIRSEEVLPGCAATVFIEIDPSGTPRCDRARARAASKCLTQTLLNASGRCLERANAAVPGCRGDEGCLASVAAAYNGCKEPVDEETRRCRQETLSQWGCVE